MNRRKQRRLIELDEKSREVTITIPMRFNRPPGRKVILTPQGEAVWAPPRIEVNDTLVRALARAHRWKRMLECGEYASAHQLAAAERITHSFICRLLKLTLLAPAIIEAILNGTIRRELQLTDLLRPFPLDWSRQYALFA
jgi:hypothetical protein